MSLKAKSSQNKAHNGATMNLISDRRAQVEKVSRARNDDLNVNSSKTLNFKWNPSLDVFLLESVREAPKNNNGTINWRTVQNNWKSKHHHLDCETRQLKNRYQVLENRNTSSDQFHTNEPLSDLFHTNELSSVDNSNLVTKDATELVISDLDAIDSVILPPSKGHQFSNEENTLLLYLLNQSKNKSDKNFNCHKSFILEAK